MKTVLRNSYSPKIGDYCETLVVDLEKQIKYLFDCDGVFTPVSGGLTEDVQEAIDEAVAGEATLREAADNAIWTEIETIEASSDVVDVVGTYAELQQYDTSKLKDNDLIKVLSDESRNDATTYYRWSTSTSSFSYVGSEGPYYTESEVDTLLSGKQDKLVAGTNIQIASDGKTISATDTTYTHFTGATASTDGVQGLVPGPLAGDQEKVLKGDGTWGEAAANTIFYRNSSETGATRHIYKNADMTGAVSMQDILDANEKGQVILRLSTAAYPENYSDAYLQNAYVGTSDYQMLFLDEKGYTSFDTTLPTDTEFMYSRRELQDKLTAGTNVQINGTTISATDTTYSDFVGTDGLVAGAAGLVPAPATTDADKYLKSDGTWATVSGGSSNVTVIYIDGDIETALSSAGGHIYSDHNHTQQDIMSWSDISALFNLPPNGPRDVYLHNTDSSDETFRVVFFYYGDHTFVVARQYNGSVDFYEVDGLVGDQTQTLFVATKFTVQPKLTAGSNVVIVGDTISAADTTYSVFTGSTSLADGAEGLVPKPFIADVDKYLKGDGTWAAVPTGPTVVQTTGQSTTDVMSQKAVTDIIGNVEAALQTLNSGAGVQ